MDYTPLVERYFAAPANAGLPPAGHGHIGRGEAGSAEQGTWVVFHARIDRETVAALTFEAFGCPHTIAACSLMTELLTGLAVREASGFEPASLRERLGIPVEKTGRLLIVQDALRNCFADWDNS